MTIRSAAPLALLLVITGCASKPVPIAIAPVPMPVPAPSLAAPLGAAANLQLPPRLPDGRFATPNANLTQTAAIWHLRTGLNVAALSCRGPEEPLVLAGYNRFLVTYKTPLATAQRSLGVTHGTVKTYETAMTRLYNYWALPPVQPAFCAAAAHVMERAATVAPAALPAFAVEALAELDRPFTDFYQAYAAWQDARAARATFAAVAPAPVASRSETQFASNAPVLRYDAAVFRAE